MRNFHQHGIEPASSHQRQNQTICPQCNDTRGHKGNKSHRRPGQIVLLPPLRKKLYVPDDAEERLKQQRRDMHRKPAAPPQHFPPSQ